jgi:hypothetical protein
MELRQIIGIAGMVLMLGGTFYSMWKFDQKPNGRIPVRVTKTEGRLLYGLIGVILTFSFLAATNLIADSLQHDKKQQIACPEYPPVDGAGRPEVCK